MTEQDEAAIHKTVLDVKYRSEPLSANWLKSMPPVKAPSPRYAIQANLRAL